MEERLREAQKVVRSTRTGATRYNETAMIKCRVCNISKDDEEFHRDKSRKSGRRTVCRSCRSETRATGSEALPSAARPVVSEEDQIRHKANLMALRQLALNHEDEFKRLAAGYRQDLGMRKRWRSAS